MRIGHRATGLVVILVTLAAAGGIVGGCLSSNNGSAPSPDAGPLTGDAAGPTPGGQDAAPNDGATPIDGTVADAAPSPDASDASSDSGPDASDAGICPSIAYSIHEIAAGGAHTCGLATDGTMLCWGDNAVGQLGMGDTITRFCPTVGLTGVTQIATGQDFTCAVETGGNVSCWGENAQGQVGQGDTAAHLSPAELPSLTNVAYVAAGGLSACAVLVGGTVSCWGDNQFGEQGNGTVDGNPHAPTVVSGLSGVSALATGGEFTCALIGNGGTVDGGAATSGTIACWGYNGDGQLGLGDTVDRHVPTVIPTLSSVTGVSAGTAFLCATLLNGTVSCWGKDEAGEVGLVATVDAGCGAPCIVSPTTVAGVSTATAVSAAIGGSHVCVTTQGGVLCWGDNLDGNLGVGDTTQRNAATAVSGSLVGATALATGYTQSCALFPDAGLDCWGDNAEGELGLGPNEATQVLTPVQVPGL